MGIEKRKFVRRKTDENVYAVSLGMSGALLGRIRNISLGGLAVQYLTDGASPKDRLRIDIFMQDEFFQMSGIPCRVVYDMPHRNGGNKIASEHAVKRKCCGLEFEKLSGVQKEQLDSLLGTLAGGTET